MEVVRHDCPFKLILRIVVQSNLFACLYYVCGAISSFMASFLRFVLFLSFAVLPYLLQFAWISYVSNLFAVCGATLFCHDVWISYVLDPSFNRMPGFNVVLVRSMVNIYLFRCYLI